MQFEHHTKSILKKNVKETYKKVLLMNLFILNNTNLWLLQVLGVFKLDKHNYMCLLSTEEVLQWVKVPTVINSQIKLGLKNKQTSLLSLCQHNTCLKTGLTSHTGYYVTFTKRCTRQNISLCYLSFSQTWLQDIFWRT